MYLVRYELFVGHTQQCAPSAIEALNLIRLIRDDGGSVGRIESTGGEVLSVAEVEDLAQGELQNGLAAALPLELGVKRGAQHQNLG